MYFYSDENYVLNNELGLNDIAFLNKAERMLNNGRAWIEIAWWVGVFPGIAIALAVLGFNILGDGLRDVLDPRLRNIED